jgi:hypothetical protein
MAKITNYARGPRGITMKDGTTVWLDPGQSADRRKDDIAGELPDLGQPAPATGEADNDLKAQLAELTSQLAAVVKERDDLKAQLAKFDPDGDGKAGGSVAAKK